MAGLTPQPPTTRPFPGARTIIDAPKKRRRGSSDMNHFNNLKPTGI